MRSGTASKPRSRRPRPGPSPGAPRPRVRYLVQTVDKGRTRGPPRGWAARFGGWTKTFTDPRLCAALVDRLTFGGNIIETGTDSDRLATTRAELSNRLLAEQRETTRPSVLHESPAPIPPSAERGSQHEVRTEGNDSAVELGVQPGNEPAEVFPSTAGQPQQHVLKSVSRHHRVTAVAADHRIRQNAPWLPQIPPAFGQRCSHCPRPQTLFFQLPDRYASRCGHTADSTNRDPSTGPPTLCAQPLRTPTRHRPFGSTYRHLAMSRTAPARDHGKPAPL
ncbi:hypothetical protein SAMN05421773_103275 [Streptomyces aidingensis]|uniref:Uncharacterized protein n=1 Tax=Streptomyces aidingensis TaxID=910347 RepID=A0A1I1J3C8_9ACTN|nr:hypothetical protein SAMN05421773_103275 [Streptomyces aidingensis]